MSEACTEAQLSEAASIQESANAVLDLLRARYPNDLSVAITALYVAVGKMGIMLHAHGAPYKAIRRQVDGALIRIFEGHEQEKAAQALEAQRQARAAAHERGEN